MSESSLTKKMLIGGSLLALGAASAYLIGALLAGADIEEEDRPPIIVNNGSIQLIAVPIKGSGGSWTNQSGVWQHEHSRGGPKKFKVHMGGKNCAPDTYSNVYRVALHYSPNAGDAPVNVVLYADPNDQSKRFLRVQTPLSASPAGIVLTLGDGTTKLVKAALFNKQDVLVADCNYADDPAPMLLIEQKNPWF